MFELLSKTLEDTKENKLTLHHQKKNAVCLNDYPHLNVTWIFSLIREDQFGIRRDILFQESARAFTFKFDLSKFITEHQIIEPTSPDTESYCWFSKQLIKDPHALAKKSSKKLLAWNLIFN